jgi:hypothetical protein
MCGAWKEPSSDAPAPGPVPRTQHIGVIDVAAPNRRGLHQGEDFPTGMGADDVGKGRLRW